MRFARGDSKTASTEITMNINTESSDELKQRLAQAERDYEVAVRACEQARMNLRQQQDAQSEAAIRLHAIRMEIAVATPVDRGARQLVDGSPVPADNSHTELKANGQQKDYVVLSPAERAKGWVRPYFDSYRHYVCGTVTTMSQKIAETYARDPWFYDGTFCVHCGAHFPLKEFGWPDGEGMDPSRWTEAEKKRVFELKNHGKEYSTHG